MEQKFLVKGKNSKGEEAKFSPAEMYLASLLRTLKSSYSSKKDKGAFFKHMMAETDGKSFSKAEVARLWEAMHKIAYWDVDSQKHIIPMSADHNLYFPGKCYRNNSNFFETYAKKLLEEGEIVVHHGRAKGYTSPAIQAHMAKMRAAKAAKKEETPEVTANDQLLDLANPTKEELSSKVDDCKQAIGNQEAKIAELEAQLSEAKTTLTKLQEDLVTAIAEEEKAKKLSLFNTLSQMAKDEGYDLKDLIKSFTE